MISFDEYCRISDHIDPVPGQRNAVTENAVFGGGRFGILPKLCMAVCELHEDDPFFLNMIAQSDCEMLYRLLNVFVDRPDLCSIISDRIAQLKENGAIPKPREQRSAVTGRSFYQILCDWLTRKGYETDSDFYNYAGISRQRFSKMRGSEGPVSRELVLHMAVALELNYEECVSFLQSAGYALNQNSRREQLISYFMRSRKYTFDEVEELLDIFHEKTFLHST